MSDQTFKITCWLASPLAGEPPFIDGLIEYELAKRQGLADKIQRHEPAPKYGEIRVPFKRELIGGVLVPCCSAPVMSPCEDGREYFAKRLATEYSDLVHADKRRKIALGNNTYKSYRLPLRTRQIERIVWFMRGTRKTVLKTVKAIPSIGHKRSMGYGRVKEWTADLYETRGLDWSWFAPCEQGQVLMRPLPNCDELPPDLIGYRADFGAVQGPMWHPDRFIERVIPC